jgi:hypothetical protein
MHNEIQEVMGQTFGVPDDIDEDELLGELDALEDELAAEAMGASEGGIPSYLQVCPGFARTLYVTQLHGARTVVGGGWVLFLA